MRNSRLALVLVVVIGVVVGLGGYGLWYSKAYAYLSDDPAACANCHIMSDSHASWGVSSHRDATCNDCHLPHDSLAGKYLAKAQDGLRHSAAFTVEKVQVLRASDGTISTVQQNCVRCHQEAVDSIMNVSQGADPQCLHCHQKAAHVL